MKEMIEQALDERGREKKKKKERPGEGERFQTSSGGD
jgi:hypothetical protein